jgi:hypothetical protein
MSKPSISELSPRAKIALDHYRKVERLRGDHKQELLSALQSRIASGAMPSAGLHVDPPILPAARGMSLAAKLTIALGVVAGLSIPAAMLMRKTEVQLQSTDKPKIERIAAAESPAPALTQEPEVPLVVLEPGADRVSERRVPRASTKVAPPAASTSEAPQTIDEEVRLLKAAQRALSSGAPARALAILDESVARFPKSKLGDARQVTRMMAVCSLGQTAQARELAKRFLAQHPSSPFSDRVRRICD